MMHEYTTLKEKFKESTAFDDERLYAQRDTIDLYWLKYPTRDPETMANQTASAFLGIRLECAQCHKHPFDRWTQEDFRLFGSFFRLVRYVDPEDGAWPRQIKRARDYGNEELVNLPGGRGNGTDGWKRNLEESPPKLLGGEQFVWKEDSPDLRLELWKWMRSPDNKYFAPALVNRVWAHYFGVGIVEPVADLSAGNPPSNPELLDWLARDFIEHGFDLKHLHRTILSSRTYQLSFVANESNEFDERCYSHALLKRMPAEVLIDAVAQVTGTDHRYRSFAAPPGTRAIALGLTRNFGDLEYVTEIFGRPLRTTTCGDCERSNEPTLNQAMYLINDQEINSRVSDKRGRANWLSNRVKDDRELVEEVYLSALSRYPSEEEMERALEFVAGAETRRDGVEDLHWVLLNVREFAFIR
jgi:hypothetical protein